MRRTASTLGLIALCTLACTTRQAVLQEGRWRAWLESPGGELPFELVIEAAGRSLRASVLNGIETLEVPTTRFDPAEGTLLLSFDHYDSRVEARLTDDGSLVGEWSKTGKLGEQTRMVFHAEPGNRARFGNRPSAAGDADAVAGRWSVNFAADDDGSVGVFEPDADGNVLGTFMTTTGDYRYLAGSFEAGRLRLSVFDGAHAFLFDARLADDGTLSGDFWSRDSWHDTWTATRDDGAALSDGFGLTVWTGGAALEQVVFPDLDGRPRSLADAEFSGRARILEIFGSWCPNCSDATRFMVELDRQYRDRGLSIVGLAFEHTGEFERDARQVRVWAEHHGVEYPLLVAGLSDKDEASNAFPLVDRIRSYPTTVFLHADGRVRAVHQGYSGPATGEAHAELRARFHEIIEELLAGGPDGR